MDASGAPPGSTESGTAASSRPASLPPIPATRLALLGLVAVSIMAPVTLPVPILRSLVSDRFEVSELLTSLFMSVNMIGAALTAPLAGVLADRFGRRRPLIVAALVFDAACFLAMTAPLSFGLFLAIRFVEGCAHIFALSLLLSIAASLVPSERRGLVMGITGAGMMLGVALGAPIGGLLGRTDVLRPLFAGSALLVIAALLAGVVLREPDEVEERPGLAAIGRAVRANRALVLPLVFSFADRFTVGFYTTTFSLFASGLHGATPPRVGLWISSFMLPFALLSFPFGMLADRYSKTALMCGGSLVYGVLTASLGFWPTDFITLGMAATGVSAAVMFVPSMLMTADLAPAAIRSTALGAFNTAGSLGFILGPLCGGLISEAVRAEHGPAAGYQAAFAIAGASVILCALVGLPFLLRLRRAGRTT